MGRRLSLLVKAIAHKCASIQSGRRSTRKKSQGREAVMWRLDYGFVLCDCHATGLHPLKCNTATCARLRNSVVASGSVELP